MTEGLDAITTAALGLALDAASLRQQAIASLIRSAAPPGEWCWLRRFQQAKSRATPSSARDRLSSASPMISSASLRAGAIRSSTISLVNA